MKFTLVRREMWWWHDVMIWWEEGITITSQSPSPPFTPRSWWGPKCSRGHLHHVHVSQNVLLRFILFHLCGSWWWGSSSDVMKRNAISSKEREIGCVSLIFSVVMFYRPNRREGGRDTLPSSDVFVSLSSAFLILVFSWYSPHMIMRVELLPYTFYF